jgi:hypothetical protein
MEAKRKILRLLINRIEIDKDEVRIVYKVQCHPFVPSPVKRGFLQDCLECHIVAQGGALRLRRFAYPGLRCTTPSALYVSNPAAVLGDEVGEDLPVATSDLNRLLRFGDFGEP